MTDLVYDMISNGVDLILIGAVLAAMIVMLRGSTQLTQLISDQQVTTEEFDYYLKYHSFDHQQGLSSADGLSAIVGNRYSLWVCIKDSYTDVDGNTSTVYYCNDPETGKYYLCNDTIVDKTQGDASTIIHNGTQLSYKELSERLDPSHMFNADILLVEGGVFQKDTFSRDAIILGLYFEYTP